MLHWLNSSKHRPQSMEQVPEKTSSPSPSMEALLSQAQGVSSINTQISQTDYLDTRNNGRWKKHCRIPVENHPARAKLEKHPSCFRKTHRAPSPTPAAMKQRFLLRPISSSLKSSISSRPVSYKTAKTVKGMKSHFLTMDRILKTKLVPRIKAPGTVSNRMTPNTDQDKEEAAPRPASPPDQDHMETPEEHKECAINKNNEQRDMNNDEENLHEEDKDEKLIDKQNILRTVKRQQERTENTARNGEEESKKSEPIPSEENVGKKIEATAYSGEMKKVDSKLAEMKNRVQALAGAFETVISLQDSQVQLPKERK